MKRLLVFLFVLSFFSSYAQEPTYTPMRGNYKFKGIRVDTLFLVPSFSDTSSANSTYLDQVAGAMIRCGNDFWMRNAATTAWLQNVNVGSGANPTVQYVDSIYRKSGKDSIYWRKGGVTLQFKDSTGGGGGTDSPDRINGTATTDVTADMNNRILYFYNVDKFKIGADTGLFSISYMNHISTFSDFHAEDTFKISSNNIRLLSNNRVKIGIEGNSDKRLGDVKICTGKFDLDLSSHNDTIYIPGTYSIATASTTYNLVFPDAALFPGQVIYVVGDYPQTIESLGGDLIDETGTQIDKLEKSFVIITSDGKNWYLHNAN